MNNMFLKFVSVMFLGYELLYEEHVSYFYIKCDGKFSESSFCFFFYTEEFITVA